jgi:hypothetical protein
MVRVEKEWVEHEFVLFVICWIATWNKIAKWVNIIEIGLEQAPFVFFIFIFSSFEHVKSLLIMGPNNTKSSSLKSDFLIINYE